MDSSEATIFSNPPHNLAAAAVIAATLQDPATERLIPGNTLGFKSALLPSALALVSWKESREMNESNMKMSRRKLSAKEFCLMPRRRIALY